MFTCVHHSTLFWVISACILVIAALCTLGKVTHITELHIGRTRYPSTVEVLEGANIPFELSADGTIHSGNMDMLAFEIATKPGESLKLPFVLLLPFLKSRQNKMSLFTRLNLRSSVEQLPLEPLSIPAAEKVNL